LAQLSTHPAALLPSPCAAAASPRPQPVRAACARPRPISAPPPARPRSPPTSPQEIATVALGLASLGETNSTFHSAAALAAPMYVGALTPEGLTRLAAAYVGIGVEAHGVSQHAADAAAALLRHPLEYSPTLGDTSALPPPPRSPLDTFSADQLERLVACLLARGREEVDLTGLVAAIQARARAGRCARAAPSGRLAAAGGRCCSAGRGGAPGGRAGLSRKRGACSAAA
jgi:hypothetical protein